MLLLIIDRLINSPFTCGFYSGWKIIEAFTEISLKLNPSRCISCRLAQTYLRVKKEGITTSLSPSLFTNNCPYIDRNQPENPFMRYKVEHRCHLLVQLFLINL